MQAAVSVAPARTQNAESSAPPSWLGVSCLWLLLSLVFVIHLPAFLCMGLDPDVSQWDLCARTVQQGGVLYRDAVENNLPGILWLHLPIRSLFGWRPEVLRLADILVVLALIGQLVFWLPATASSVQRLLAAGALLVFYLSTSEWVHCQRDTWMLLPALAALSLRYRQIQRLSGARGSFPAISGPAFVEGLLWAAAFWIKPFVAIPALLCWLLSACLIRRGPDLVGKLAFDGAGVLSGGLVAGGIGCLWLVGTGAWAAFYEIVFIWNRQYLASNLTGEGGCVSIAGLCQRLYPWIMIHLLAVPEALFQMGRTIWRRPAPGAPKATQPLLAGLYLGWLLQALWLQHPFDYVHVPPLLLGLTLVAGRVVSTQTLLIRPLGLVLLLLCVLIGFPTLTERRLGVWSYCVRAGSTPPLRDHLILTPKGVRWSELERVRGFLAEQGARDGEVSCTHMDMVTLFLELDVKPATRFHFLYSPVRIFRQQRDLIHGELTASLQRFVVCDVEGQGIDPAGLPAALNPAATQSSISPTNISYPWCDRIVFRAGRYLVLQLSGAETLRWLAATYRV